MIILINITIGLKSMGYDGIVIRENPVFCPQKGEGSNFVFNIGYKRYLVLHEYMKKHLDYYMKAIEKPKLANNIPRLLKQFIPNKKLSALFCYGANRHIFNCQYNIFDLYFPLERKMSSRHSIRLSYAFQFNEKIKFQVFDFEKELRCFREDKSQLVKGNVINNSELCAKKSEGGYKIQLGVAFLKPINYRYLIKLPISSYHSYNLIYTKDRFFSHKTEHSFFYNMHKNLNLSLSYYMECNTKAKESQYGVAASLSVFLGEFVASIRYGLLKYKSIMSLVAHEIGISVGLNI